jgi:hypothetical protein
MTTECTSSPDEGAVVLQAFVAELIKPDTSLGEPVRLGRPPRRLATNGHQGGTPGESAPKPSEPGPTV